MMKSYFVTGTGTGVGKTVLTAALLAAARRAGHDVVPMKPVQTGAIRVGEHWQAPDLDVCLRAAGIQVDEAAYREMTPYCFEPPCSPHLAARAAGIALSKDVIRASLKRLEAHHEAVIVEGAGGVLVPLDDRSTMLDLMTDLGLPVLIAASPRLGTLNHTLLTLKTVKDRGLEVAGVVLVETVAGPWGAIEWDNVATIETMGGVPVLGILPFSGDLEEPATALVHNGSSVLAALDN